MQKARMVLLDDKKRFYHYSSGAIDIGGLHDVRSSILTVGLRNIYSSGHRHRVLRRCTPGMPVWTPVNRSLGSSVRSRCRWGQR